MNLTEVACGPQDKWPANFCLAQAQILLWVSEWASCRFWPCSLLVATTTCRQTFKKNVNQALEESLVHLILACPFSQSCWATLVSQFTNPHIPLALWLHSRINCSFLSLWRSLSPWACQYGLLEMMPSSDKCSLQFSIARSSSNVNLLKLFIEQRTA